MRDMREESPRRLQFFNRPERLLDRRMGGVRVMAQRVQEENVEPGELLLAFGRDLAVIREIRAIAKLESVHGALAVIHANRLNGDTGYVDRCILEQMRAQPGSAGLTRRVIEHVMERLLDNGESRGRGVDGDVRLLHKIERADIVQAKDVVGMRVREENRVNPIDAVTQRLIAEIGRGIDENAFAP